MIPTLLGLIKAVIIEGEETDDGVEEKFPGIILPFMFNPEDYTVEGSNVYELEFENESDVPKMEYSKPGPKTLKLSTLYFDTYELPIPMDVSLITRFLWDLMKPTTEYTHSDGTTKKKPPPVIFRWGLFQFYAVIISCTQKFTLFNQFGIPLRAEVTLVLQQHLKTEMFAGLPQNPTSGGGPIERIWRVKAGDRLDLIADKVYRDSTKWRLIADRNGISNPLSIRAGQSLRIPPKSIGTL